MPFQPTVIDTQPIRLQIVNSIKEKLNSTSITRSPKIAAILVGNHPASLTYVNTKKNACDALGFLFELIHLPESISQKEILQILQGLNADTNVDAILVQMPLPQHINKEMIIHSINPNKDVDGFHPINLGKLVLQESDALVPCTALAVQAILLSVLESIQGKHVAIVGRSHIVGIPLSILLSQKHPQSNATVTLINSFSQNMPLLLKTADIIVCCLGKANFLKKEMVSSGATVIDVGINRVADSSQSKGYRIVGDVDFKEVFPLCQYITSVPKGVGPITVAMLLKNTWKCYEKNNTLVQ